MTGAAELAADSELRAFWERCAATVERRGGASGTVALAGAGERRAVGRLLGRRLGDGVGAIRLAALDAALRDSPLGAGVVEVVTQALGRAPRDRPAERRQARERRELMWEAALAHPAVARHQWLGDWLTQLGRTGTLSRIARDHDPAAVLGDALGVLAALPVAETELRTLLATRVLRNPKALDPDRPVGRLVLRALAFGAGVPVRGSSERRDLWYRMNVVCDRLSTTVLVYNLRMASGPAAYRAILDGHAALGEPLHLSLRMLQSWERAARQRGEAVHWEDRVVFVCENPSVVDEAASALGAGGRPLICVEGQMSLAARWLLGALLDDTVELRYHGDFDWGGVEIANSVMGLCRTAGARVTPWRYRTSDYLEALQTAAGDELGGRPVSALWDPELHLAMEANAAVVYEEGVSAQLVADLRRSDDPRRRHGDAAE